MNILFINYNYPNPEKGGTGRAIINISKYLIANGINVFIAFLEDEPLNNSLFKKGIKISKGNKSKIDFNKYLIENQIEIVINFTWGLNKYIIRTIKESDCFLINTLSFEPLYFYKISENLIYQKRYYFETKYKLRRLFSFFYKYGTTKISNYQIRELLKLSDKFVVLSNNYKDLLIKLFKLNIIASQKILSIHNSLSYLNNEIIFNNLIKEKRVLIVSRMDDLTKRITLALDIWKNVFEKIGDDSWQLDIVGGGHDKDKIIKFANDNGVKNVNFFDAQEPRPFYVRSKIFLMTSCSEGFPMTLTEAQQFGCIPIAFNSYEALPEIINDSENGFIIEEGNIKGYEEKLLELMNNPGILDKMIEQTIESTRRFDISVIGPQWLELLNSRQYEQNT